MRTTTGAITARTHTRPYGKTCLFRLPFTILEFVYPFCVSRGRRRCSWCSLESAARPQLWGSFNTLLPCALEEAVMSCNRGHVIIAWILESDVRGKRKLANSQTKSAKVRGSPGRGPEWLKDFPSSVSLFLSLKASLLPSNGSQGQLAASSGVSGYELWFIIME